MTSAPKSESTVAAPGPAMKLARSTTFKPENMFSVSIASPVMSKFRSEFRIVDAFKMRPRTTPVPGRICHTLAALELGSTLDEKGGRALFLVFSCGAERKERSLDQQAFIQACVRSSVYRFNGEFHALGSVGADLLEDSFRADDKAAARHDFIDEANAISFICPDDVAGKNELQGPAFVHYPGKTLCTSVPLHDSYFHFRLAEFRRFAGQADGAGHLQFAAAAHRIPVHGSDDWFAQVFDQARNSLSQAGFFFRFNRSIVEHLADVSSRSECFFAGPGKDHPRAW